MREIKNENNGKSLYLIDVLQTKASSRITNGPSPHTHTHIHVTSAFDHTFRVDHSSDINTSLTVHCFFLFFSSTLIDQVHKYVQIYTHMTFSLRKEHYPMTIRKTERKKDRMRV